MYSTPEGSSTNSCLNRRFQSTIETLGSLGSYGAFKVSVRSHENVSFIHTLVEPNALIVFRSHIAVSGLNLNSQVGQ